MNILYLSKLDGRPWIGPTYSVPNQVLYQSKYDNVLWYNRIFSGVKEGLCNLEKWRNFDCYIDYNDLKVNSIKELPAPFNNPDLIIVEQCYPFATDLIRFDLIKNGYPYIIIPRGELTDTAQKKKRFKKKIGNLILGYYGFVNHSLAIEFLTEQERSTTSTKWNTRFLVIPNGTQKVKNNIRKIDNKEGIEIGYIGRLEPFQKGLDVLVLAVIELQNNLRTSNAHIHLYGSDVENKCSDLKEMVIDNNIDDLISFNDAIFNESKEQVLKNFDVFVMPSRFEGHPTGLLEAMAWGLPVIVSEGTNMKAEVEVFDAGWTCESTTASLVCAIDTMLNERNTLLAKGQNALKLSKEYQWDSIAKNSHDKYVELMASFI